MNRPRKCWIVVPLLMLLTTVAHGAKDCMLAGEATPTHNASLYDTDGRAFARFTGSRLPLAVTSWPKAEAGRIQVQTGKGGAHFRLRGAMNIKEFPIYTQRDVAVNKNHVWIAANRRVHFSAQRGNRLRVNRELSYPLEQRLSGWGDCAAFGLEPPQGPPARTYPEGRGFLIVKPGVLLFDTYDSYQTAILELRRARHGEGVFVWSSEQRRGHRRIHYFGDVILDAWVKQTDLKWMPPGEITDQLMPPARQVSAPKLRLSGEPTLVTPRKRLTLRLNASDKGAVIGEIAANTPTYIVDVVAGWASVLPKSLNIAPAGEFQFWVRLSELNAASNKPNRAPKNPRSTKPKSH